MMRLHHLSRMVLYMGDWIGSRKTQCGDDGRITGDPGKVTCEKCKRFVVRGTSRMDPCDAEDKRRAMFPEME